ncbi:MAG: ABC transporter permease [Mycobacteriales bacterium]
MADSAFARTAWTSYRWLLGWLRPAAFLAAKVANPVGQVVLFSLLGAAVAGGRPASWYVVGNALLVCAFGGLYGLSITLSTARNAGLVGYLAIAPRPSLWTLSAFALPHVLDGLVTSAALLTGGLLVTRTVPGAPVALLVCVLLAAASAAALGLVTSQFSLLARDGRGILTNVVYLLTLLLCGANLDPDRLPALLRPAAEVWPLRHAIGAARHAVDGRWAVGEMAAELAVAAVLAAVAVLGAHHLQSLARRRGTLDGWL